MTARRDRLLDPATISDPAVLEELIERLGRLRPETPRRWGTLTAPEMLTHLADAGDFALGRRIWDGLSPTPRSRPVFRWLLLYLIPWPRGIMTRASFDPRRNGTRPADFDADRRRVVEGLRDLAACPAERLAAAHGRFGVMSRADWHRWAWRHTDHHLRQFGL